MPSTAVRALFFNTLSSTCEDPDILAFFSLSHMPHPAGSSITPTLDLSLSVPSSEGTPQTLTLSLFP